MRARLRGATSAFEVERLREEAGAPIEFRFRGPIRVEVVDPKTGNVTRSVLVGSPTLQGEHQGSDVRVLREYDVDVMVGGRTVMRRYSASTAREALDQFRHDIGAVPDGCETVDEGNQQVVDVRGTCEFCDGLILIVVEGPEVDDRWVANSEGFLICGVCAEKGCGRV